MADRSSLAEVSRMKLDHNDRLKKQVLSDLGERKSLSKLLAKADPAEGRRIPGVTQLPSDKRRGLSSALVHKVVDIKQGGGKVDAETLLQINKIETADNEIQHKTTLDKQRVHDAATPAKRLKDATDGIDISDSVFKQKQQQQELKVILTGRTLIPQTDNDTSEYAAFGRENTPADSYWDSVSVTGNTGERPVSSHLSKPAILAAVGTSTKAQLVARPPPHGHRGNTTITTSRPGSAQRGTSAKKVLVCIPRESAPNALDSSSQDTIQDTVTRQDSVTDNARQPLTSAKSTRDLLAEAQRISRESFRPATKSSSNVDTRPTGKPSSLTPSSNAALKQTSRQSIDQSASKLQVPAEPKERSVEEIIASLKHQDQEQGLSEADKRIKEIMDRMASRTKMIMDELEPLPSRKELVEESVLIPTARQGSATSVSVSHDVALPTSLALDTGDDDQLLLLGDNSSKRSVTSASDFSQVPAPNEVTYPLTSSEDISAALKPEGHAQTILEMLDKLPRQPSAVSDKENIPPPKLGPFVDFEQIRREAQLLSAVTREDIVSIKATQKPLHSKGPLPTESSSEDDVPVKQHSHVGRARDVGSTHHFCTLTTDQSLTGVYRGAWNRHHIQQLYGLQSDTVADGRVSQQPEETLARRRSAAAQRIINEIGNLVINQSDASRTLQGWQSLANHVFEPGDMTVDGTKMQVHPGQSSLYWSLAPAKWDVAPARVVEQLCPDYLDRLLPQRLPNIDVDEDEDEEDGDAASDALSKADSKERLRSRNFGSADDILGLLKEEDEEEERSSPSSHHQLSTSRHSMLSKTSSMHQHTSVSALGKADSQTLLVPPKVSSTFHPSVSTASLPTAMLSASIDMCPDTPAVSLISELKRAITQLPLGDYPKPTQLDLLLTLAMAWHEDLASPTSSQSLALKIALLNQITQKYALFEDLGPTGVTIQCSHPSSVQVHLSMTLSKPMLRERHDEIITYVMAALTAYGGAIFANGNYITMTQDPVITLTQLESKQKAMAATASESDASRPERPVTHKVAPSKRLRSARIRRSKSAPGGIRRDDDDTPIIMQDFYITMDELAKQKDQLHELCTNPPKATSKTFAKSGTNPAQTTSSTAAAGSQDKIENVDGAEQAAAKPKKQFLSRMYKDTGPTAAEMALAAGRNYVVATPGSKNSSRHSSKASKRSKKKGKDSRLTELEDDKIDEIMNMLATSNRTLQRSESSHELDRQLDPDVLPSQLATVRRRSIPMLFDFEDFKQRQRYRPGQHENEREWVRNIWNGWFDIVFPPPAETLRSPDDVDFRDNDDNSTSDGKTKTAASGAVVNKLPDVIELAPLVECKDDEDVVKILQAEVMRLTDELNESNRCRSYHLCRRGALNRKLGMITAALNDLNEAIIIEPRLLNAYWHRHLVYLLLNRKRDAQSDLNEILHINRYHVDALRSLASISRDSADWDQAINYYSQVIKLKPNDYESFCRRGEIYEKKGDTLLAMEDYLRATRINPAKTDALLKHGLHYFRNKNWQGAMHDFSELLRQDPSNANARLYRGQTYMELKQWDHAIRDFSAAIHYDPNCAKAFFHRACILRKINPERALQDFSTSLLIDDGIDNILCFLHRGLLYDEMGKYEEAVPDFECVLQLDPAIAVAHVNIGLIYMLRLNNVHKAVKRFSSAIHTNPTYLRAYLCRAEAFIKLGETEKALIDVTKAIHLRPDVTPLVLQRGQLLLKLGKLPLAAHCIRQAAEMGEGLGQSASQQALVLSFLSDFDKAIAVLEAAIKSKPIAPLYMLLGRIQTKAKKWLQAAGNFEKAIEILVAELTRGKRPWEKTVWPQEVVELYYYLGICRAQVKDNLRALDAYNSAIKMNPKFAEAYYERGIAKIRLQQKGLVDFNRALALNPNLFQAYLSRAAYYGMKGQFCKAILNCNEAVRIQPQSVRAYLYRGALKYHIHSYPLAIRDLTMAVTLDSRCALAYFNRAICYQDSGNVEKALQDYSIVLLLDEAWLIEKVYVNRGLLYFSLRDFVNARHDFLMASQRSRSDRRILHSLALCDHKLGKLHDSVKCYTLCLQLDPFFIDALICRGNAFLDFGNDLATSMARHDYERAIHLDPRCMKARVNLAFSYQMVGHFQKAWNELTVAIAVDDKFAPAYEARAVINLQMGNKFGALQDICAAIKVKATAELLTNRGVIQQVMGDLPSAMADYQRAAKLDTSYSLAFYNAANLYFRNRQYPQALEYYNAALAADDQNESAFINRAITRSVLKDTRGALEDFTSAANLSPHTAHIYYNRGNLHASLEHWPDALQDFTQALTLKPDDPLVLKRRADILGKLERTSEALTDYQRAVDLETKRWVYK